jgi:hypothetical protein
MLSNVPAVSDVFLRPMRKNAKHFYGRKKIWRSKTHKGRKPDWVLRSLAALAAYTYRPVRRSLSVHYLFLYILIIIKIFPSTNSFSGINFINPSEECHLTFIITISTSSSISQIFSSFSLYC